MVATLTMVVMVSLGWTQLQKLDARSSETAGGLLSINQEAEMVVDGPIQPIFPSRGLNSDAVALGEKLFYDARLSASDDISCASCHDLSHGGDQGRPDTVGIHGRISATNSPTVFNASLNIAQFWDGRAESLEDQIDGPIHNPKEMATDWTSILGKLNADQYYSAEFSRLYSEGVTELNIKHAIAEFERSLLTVNSPFDRFLLGDQAAISDKAKTGFELFKDYGCVACHQGKNVGGNMYQPLGIMGDYFADRNSEIQDVDLGRFNVTGLEQDKHVFRVPSLRLAAVTAPYFHDGSAATLNDAVRAMIKYQVGRTATLEDEEYLVAFIESLAGEYRGQLLSP